MIELANNPQSNNNQVVLDAVDTEFFNRINNRITMYGQIPYNIPKMLIIDCIKSAARYFYELYPGVTKPTHYLVKLSDFDSVRSEISTGHADKTIQERSKFLKLSHRISVVRKIHEPKFGYNFHDMIDETYSNQGHLSGDKRHTGIDNNLFFTEITSKMVEVNMINAIMGTTIAFKFNQQDKTLYLKSAPRFDNLLIECKANVHIHNLYNDPYFERLVLGYSKRELKRLIGGHTFELPGGVVLNADEICNNLEDIETVEEKIKMMSTMGDIIIKR